MAGLGLSAGVAITIGRSRCGSIPIIPLLNGILLAVLVGLAGARLLHVLDSWPFYSQRPWLIPFITEGGMVSYGGIIGGGIAGWLYLRRRIRSLSLVADSAGLGLLAGHGIALFGEFLNGEHSGVPSRLPWAVIYTHPESLAGGGGAVHPAAGYEIDLGLVLLRRSCGGGRTYGSTRRSCCGPVSSLFSLGRLGAGFFRQDAVYLLTLPLTQSFASLGVAIGLGFLTFTWFRGARAARR